MLVKESMTCVDATHAVAKVEVQPESSVQRANRVNCSLNKNKMIVSVPLARKYGGKPAHNDWTRSFAAMLTRACSVFRYRLSSPDFACHGEQTP